MDDTRHRLLKSLDQRAFHTGTELGARLGLTRAAVHKHVQALVARGVPIHRVPGRGYRLADGVSLLDAHAIASRLSDRAAALLAGIDVLEEVDSTSAELARRRPVGDFGGRICLAEKQTAGRGRRGRSWIASPYRDIMMSLGVEYPQWPVYLPTLGLVTALMVVEALEQLGARDLVVKWPNDIVDRRGKGKVCGVLLDVAGEAHGPCRVVVGIGINVSADDGDKRDIDQQWIDLASMSGQTLDRNGIVAACLNLLLPAFERFPDEGFAPYRTVWRRRDGLRDRWVAVHGATGTTFEGRAAGADESGRLQVVGADGGLRAFTQGEVSVRLS